MKKAFVFAIAAAVCCSSLPVAAAESAIVVESLTIQPGENSTQVFIQSDRPLKLRHSYSSSPPGITLYPLSPAASARPSVLRSYDEMIEEVRFLYADGATPSGRAIPLESIYIRLKRQADYTLQQKDWVTLVDVRPGKAGPAAQLPEVVDPMPSVAEARRRDWRPMPLPEGATLEDALRVGLNNHLPLRFAEEDYKTARFRHFEAARAMLPSLRGRYTKAHGVQELDPGDRSLDQAFTRKEYGLEIGQPLFQSGRLYYGLRQAELQKKISAENLRKAKNDTVMEIKRAYYNLAKARRALDSRREALSEARGAAEMARKKRQLEVITEAEALSVESQFGQLEYKFLSEEKDFEIAKLRFAAQLNLPEDSPVELALMRDDIDPNKIRMPRLTITEVVDRALANRPDAAVSAYNARFANYSAKTAKAGERLRLDANGFVGRSGSAYDDDLLNDQAFKLRSSWNFGVQASLFFFGSTLRGFNTAEKSAPNLAESSRSQNRAVTAEMGFLDSLRTVSDRRQAYVSRDRAALEYEQSLRSIESEARQAYHNLEKALYQLRSARQERDFRLKDLQIVRQKERLNIADPSQRLAAEGAATEANAAWYEAVAFYRVAVAGLEQAVAAPVPELADLP